MKPIQPAHADVYFLNFLLKTAKPANPLPTNNIVAGSGTGCGAGGLSVSFSVSVLYSDQEVSFFLAFFLIKWTLPLFPDRELKASAFPSGVISSAKGASKKARHTATLKKHFNFEQSIFSPFIDYQSLTHCGP